MPINYKDYPPNWKTEIRPRILERANNCCEFCGVPNKIHIFRGYLLDPLTKEKQEVYQDSEGRVFDASDSSLLFKSEWVYIEPLSGKEDQKAIKVVLTIAHLDHDEKNHDVKDDRLAALCQKCHLNYDKAEKKRRREEKKKQIKLEL